MKTHREPNANEEGNGSGFWLGNGDDPRRCGLPKEILGRDGVLAVLQPAQGLAARRLAATIPLSMRRVPFCRFGGVSAKLEPGWDGQAGSKPSVSQPKHPKLFLPGPYRLSRDSSVSPPKMFRAVVKAPSTTTGPAIHSPGELTAISESEGRTRGAIWHVRSSTPCSSPVKQRPRWEKKEPSRARWSQDVGPQSWRPETEISKG